jgi:hypothetical protein
VRHLKATLEQQLGDVTKAELVAQTPQHREQDHVRRVLEIVERRAGALVEDGGGTGTRTSGSRARYVAGACRSGASRSADTSRAILSRIVGGATLTERAWSQT